ncbi:MAG: hypothetical protein LH606_12020 [Cytophagaceae bacterium]|nr:hypothetical protein [Cytophagaceae bacterium]
MAKYKLVEEAAIEHKNEYFEIRFTNGKRSIYFTSNEENLETTAAAIVADHARDAQDYHLLPHRKH